ncbi:phage terminase small subunit P27 family [soil metagenome]
MRGRKPKPARLRLIHGSRAKTANDRQPKPPLQLPSCPSHLLPAAKAEWKRVAKELYDLGYISRLDRAALAGYCQCNGRWVECEKKLQETPAILKMPSGYIQQNPWLTISTKQMELMCKFATELGITPSSRSRIETVPPNVRKPWE